MIIYGIDPGPMGPDGEPPKHNHSIAIMSVGPDLVPDRVLCNQSIATASIIESVGKAMHNGFTVCVGIEKITPHGHAVGNEVFDTIRSEQDIYRLIHILCHTALEDAQAQDKLPENKRKYGALGWVERISRTKTRTHIAGPRANDAKVRAALMKRFPECTRKNGWIGSHVFAALAVAIVVWEEMEKTLSPGRRQATVVCSNRHRKKDV